MKPSQSAHPVVIVGAGAAGLAVAASLLKRRPDLDVVVIDPAEVHHYQPGWTLVGAGVFPAGSTTRAMASVMPRGARHIASSVIAFEPGGNLLLMADGRTLRYRQLVVCPGLTLDWDAIPGLKNALGTNGVTSNYRVDLAPYTWDLVQRFRGGKALFTQPAMPIKCAGAPQKALYLSCDHWMRTGVLDKTKVGFHNAGAVLFGVPEYVPALMEYIARYQVDLRFGDNLIAVDGERKVATFARSSADGTKTTFETDFDMLHAVPPQRSPDFIRTSPLADATGWIDVDPATLRHKRHPHVFALGDVAGTGNAKTAAAVRKQAPVVAHNVLAALGMANGTARYDGYGSCPLTVERGKVVLAEFLYGGKVAPTFPRWMLDGTRPSRAAWLLKERGLPLLYWQAMLKGREWLARPEVVL